MCIFQKLIFGSLQVLGRCFILVLTNTKYPDIQVQLMPLMYHFMHCTKYAYYC